MQYASSLPSPRSMAVPLAALVIGAGAATATYALVDGGEDALEAATRVIVVETPASETAQIPGKNEATTAAAVGSRPVVSATDEAATAAAIGAGSDSSDDEAGISLVNP